MRVRVPWGAPFQNKESSVAKIIIEYEKDQDAADDIDDVRQTVARRNPLDSPNVTLKKGDKCQCDALDYIESYLEGAVDSEDVDGVLMSAKPLLIEVRKFLHK